MLTTVRKLAEEVHCAASPAVRDALVRQYIEQDPNRPGIEDARTKLDAIPVWALLSYLDGVGGNTDVVVEDFGISPETVDAVLLYFLEHAAVITARIQANRLPDSIVVSQFLVARFYFDEMVSKRKAAPALRNLNHDVVTTEDVGQKGLPDYLQLLYAYHEQRIFVTKNKKDFALLHGAWLSWGHPAHYGILMIPDNVEDGQLMRQIDVLMRRSTPLGNRLFEYSLLREWREVPILRI